MIVNCTQFLYGSVKMDAYKAARGLIEAGVVSGYDMTDEAVLGKLFYLLSQPNMTQQDVKEAFNVSLQGEVTIYVKYEYKKLILLLITNNNSRR